MPAERLYLVPTGATPALDKHLALIWKMDLETRLSLQAYSDAFKKTIRVVTSSGRNAPEDAVTGEWYYKQLNGKRKTLQIVVDKKPPSIARNSPYSMDAAAAQLAKNRAVRQANEAGFFSNANIQEFGTIVNAKIDAYRASLGNAPGAGPAAPGAGPAAPGAGPAAPGAGPAAPGSGPAAKKSDGFDSGSGSDSDSDSESDTTLKKLLSHGGN